MFSYKYIYIIILFYEINVQNQLMVHKLLTYSNFNNYKSEKVYRKFADITVSPSLENFVPKFLHEEVEVKSCGYLVFIWSLRSQVNFGPFSESHRTSTIGIWRPLSCFTSCFVISTKSSSINGHFIERNMNVGETFFRFDTWNCRMYVAYFTR